MKIITAVKIKFNREYNEYQVKAYDENGNRYPAADYFTNDKEDAQHTANAMLANRNQ